MGIFFGRNAGAASYRYADELARKLDGKGAGRTRGGGRLLTLMRQGRDAENLGPKEAAQAARELREAAGKLRGDDRRAALGIARDAQEAADNGRPWRVG